jgi:hypothetical protein
MIAFLVLALFSGVAFAGVGAAMGAGIWAVLLWYGAGCWAGFLLFLAAIVTVRRWPWRRPALQTGPAISADR